MTDKALQFLLRDFAAHVDMLEIIRRGSGNIIYAERDAVLLRDGQDAYMLAAEDEAAILPALELMENPEALAAHGAFMPPLIETRFGMKADMVCYQAVWMRGELPDMVDAGLPIKRLDETYLDAVDSMYAHGGSEYIRGRLRQGEVYGALDGDRLAGFIGTHQEGAIGMLEVAQEYRRRSLGTALLLHTMHRLRRSGCHIYSHIEVHNHASLALNEKVGFHICKKPVTWME